MNSILINSFCTTLLLLPLFACVPEPLEVKNIPEARPQIVVSTQLIADRSLLVLLTRTFNALDFSEKSDPEELLEQIALNDAIVTLSGPAGTDTLRHLESGFYGDIVVPFKEGETYELRIRSESMGEVFASTRVQARVPFEEVEAELYISDFGDTLALIRYSLQDPLEDNWYMFNVQKFKQESQYENVLNPRAYTKLFDDAEFQGNLYHDQLRFTPIDYAPGDTIALTLSNLSPEYYHFMQLRLDNRFNFMDFLGEPVNYPSNIIGGKGYFNLFVPDVALFILE